jgi:hypothetical protein
LPGREHTDRRSGSVCLTARLASRGYQAREINGVINHMTSDSANGGYRLTAWVVGGSALVALALVARLSGSSWNFVGDPDGLTVRR